MLEEEDRKAIIVTVLDMLNEQIVAPIEKLFVALLFGSSGTRVGEIEGVTGLKPA
jgi:hypothetical protein